MSGTWVRRTAVASVLLVALVAAVCSYAHMQALAVRSGEEWRSLIIPLSVDGMLVASTLAIVDRRRAGNSAGWVPWFGLSLGILASLAANVAAARPDPIARVIAAWPPLAFAVAVETLVIVLRGRQTGAGESEPPTPEAAGSSTGALPVSVRDLPPVKPEASSGRTKSTPAPSKPKRAKTLPAPTDRTVSETRAAALLASGAGRRRISRELGVSEHQARVLLEQYTAEKTPNNGVKVLEEAK